MSRYKYLMLIGGSVLVLWATAWGSPVNGGFDAGLANWTTSGDVVAAGGRAVLGDNSATHSILYQSVWWPSGSLTLDFEFQNLLSDQVGEGAFLDGFYASLYFIDDPASFDLANHVYDGVIPLFDMDAGGTYNVTGSIGPGNNGPGWYHYSGSIQNQNQYVIPVFDLFDLNRQSADSLFLLDDVSMVPEPSSLALFWMGAAIVIMSCPAFSRCAAKLWRTLTCGWPLL